MNIASGARLLLAFLVCLAPKLLNAGPASLPPLSVMPDPKGVMAIIEWDNRDLPLALETSPNLTDWSEWPEQPAGSGRAKVEVPTQATQAFFRLEPTAPPRRIEGFGIEPLPDALALHWEADPLASGYILYVGDSPDVGPEKHLKAYDGLQDSDFLLVGYPSETVLYFAVQGVNRLGKGPATAPMPRVFGRTGRVGGVLGIRGADTDGTPVVKAVPGVPVVLLLQPDGAEAGHVTTGPDGRFEFVDVAPGDYRLRWDGTDTVLAGGLKDGFRVTTGLYPLGDVWADRQPGTVFGRVHFTGGSPAVFIDRMFQVDLRASVTATDPKGATLATTPVDGDGSFAVRLPPDAAFPVTLVAAFRGTTTTLPLPSPGAAGAVDLVLDPEPARIVRAVPVQEGVRVPVLDCGRPVIIETEVEAPSQRAVDLRWVAQTAGGRILGWAKGPNPVFDLQLDRDTVVHLHGMADVEGGIPTVLDLRLTARCGIFGRFTGRVARWDETEARSLEPVSGATVRARIGSLVRSATTDDSGNFELVAVPPTGSMVLTIEKPGYVPWSWRFDGRPTEKEYGMIPVTVDSGRVPAAGEGPARLSFLRYGLVLPPGSLKSGDVAYAGPVTIEHALVPLGDTVRHPFPPNPMERLLGIEDAANPTDYFWLSIRGADGQVLEVAAGDAAPVLTYDSTTSSARILLGRDDARGLFEFLESKAGVARPPFHQFEYRLTRARGMWGTEADIVRGGSTVELGADRSLNYPFDVLVKNSAFPVTVHGPGQHDIGTLRLCLFQPFTAPRYQVLDQRQAPGAFYPDLAAPAPLASFRKAVIIDFRPEPTFTVPQVTPVRLGIGRTLPELTPPVATTGYGTNPPAGGRSSWRVESLETPNAFLAPSTAFADTASPHHPHVAETYYAAIAAPTTLAHWRQRNGFPSDLSAVPAAGTYVTTYYYNMGDLGFARRLTLRRTEGVDGLPNVAMAVTNFRNIEEARDDLAPIATVCMEYARHGRADGPRFVKFTAYDEHGSLANEISLDGAPPKPMPNLCVVCHGGRAFDPVGRNPNLGSSFLPFDLESFTYHHQVGTQKAAFAELNAAVLETDPAPAIRDLIQGWYGTDKPRTAPGRFEAGYVPDGWSGSADGSEVYHDAFRTSCRICHISRPASVQFDSFERFQLFNSGVRRQVCLVSGGMPATQRTWSIFWGGRAARTLQHGSGLPVTAIDYPAQLLGRAPLSNLSDLLRRR